MQGVESLLQELMGEERRSPVGGFQHCWLDVKKLLRLWRLCPELENNKVLVLNMIVIILTHISFLCFDTLGANDLHVVQLMSLPCRHLLLQYNPEWLILLVPRLSLKKGCYFDK